MHLTWNESSQTSKPITNHRTHSSLGGHTPAEAAGGIPKLQAKLRNFRWQTHCRGIFQLPAAA